MTSQEPTVWTWSDDVPQALDGGHAVIAPGTCVWFKGNSDCLNDPKLRKHPMVIVGYVINPSGQSQQPKLAIGAALTGSESPLHGEDGKVVGPIRELANPRDEQVFYKQLTGKYSVNGVPVDCRPAKWKKLTRRMKTFLHVVRVSSLGPLFGSDNINRNRLDEQSWRVFMNNAMSDDDDFRQPEYHLTYLGTFQRL